MTPSPPRRGRYRRPARRGGFSLVELMIVVGLFSIMATLGMGVMGDVVPRYRARKAARQLAESMNRCRMAAIESTRECRVLLVAFDDDPENPDAANAGEFLVQLGDAYTHSGSWDTLPVDSIADGSDDDDWEGHVSWGAGGNSYLKHVSLLEWSDITGPGSGNSDAIVFTPRGFVDNPASDFSSDVGSIELSVINKVAAGRGLREVFSVNVYPSGIVRLVP